MSRLRVNSTLLTVLGPFTISTFETRGISSLKSLTDGDTKRIINGRIHYRDGVLGELMTGLRI